MTYTVKTLPTLLGGYCPRASAFADRQPETSSMRVYIAGDSAPKNLPKKPKDEADMPAYKEAMREELNFNRRAVGFFPSGGGMRTLRVVPLDAGVIQKSIKENTYLPFWVESQDEGILVGVASEGRAHFFNMSDVREVCLDEMFCPAVELKFFPIWQDPELTLWLSDLVVDWISYFIKESKYLKESSRAPIQGGVGLVDELANWMPIRLETNDEDMAWIRRRSSQVFEATHDERPCSVVYRGVIPGSILPVEEGAMSPEVAEALWPDGGPRVRHPRRTGYEFNSLKEVQERPEFVTVLMGKTVSQELAMWFVEFRDYKGRKVAEMTWEKKYPNL